MDELISQDPISNISAEAESNIPVYVNPLTKIQPLVFPIIGTATRLLVRVLPFDTIHTTCNLYFELQDEDRKVIYSGNYTLTDSEFATWASDNVYLEDLVCAQLVITKA